MESSPSLGLKQRKNPPYFILPAQLDNNALISAYQVHKTVVKLFMTKNFFMTLITLDPWQKIFIIKTFKR